MFRAKFCCCFFVVFFAGGGGIVNVGWSDYHQ